MEELEFFSNVFTYMDNAKLVRDIAYIKDMEGYVVPKGTPIYVDLSKGIALINGDHVEVFPEEYEIIACA